MRVLVINAGSSSLKYQLRDSPGGQIHLQGRAERISGPDGHRTALGEVIRSCGTHPIDAVGHRVVHGGPEVSAARIVDDALEATIERSIHLAPLHNPANLAGIRAARAALPGVPQVAVFDTAFHGRLPRRARSYAIDPELAEARGIRRYGFHGTSHAFVAQQAADYLGQPLSALRLVTLHLGNGASACAVELGRSVETSMGLTPMEGLVMGTRSGDVDPGVVLELVRELGSAEAVDELLNRHSGLAGLSGLGNDLRDIERAAAEGNERARLAVVVFAHRVRKYLGAYAAVLGSLDAVVLTGGIGENATAMRQRILQRLELFGLLFDEERNRDARVDDEHPVAEISAPHSRVRALVVATDEGRMIARQTAALLRDSRPSADPGLIPLAISARHAHLTRETLVALFGPETELTRLRDLSQPGQFACEQQVSLVGPRGRIDGVRILGPLRSKNQVEISRTDEFHLGVDAPVRRSGQVEGSAPVTLEGPRGTVRLPEGLICAWRHIHMTPADAARYGVRDGDQVEVAIESGPRELTFGDVLIRVKEDYRLEMHIDTDEANAAELSPGAEGELVDSLQTARIRSPS